MEVIVNGNKLWMYGRRDSEEFSPHKIWEKYQSMYKCDRKKTKKRKNMNKINRNINNDTLFNTTTLMYNLKSIY